MTIRIILREGHIGCYSLEVTDKWALVSATVEVSGRRCRGKIKGGGGIEEDRGGGMEQRNETSTDETKGATYRVIFL